MRRSTLTFIVVCAVLLGLKLLFDAQPANFPLAEQAEAFSWTAVAIILAVGVLGFFADRRVGFPEPFTDRRRELSGFVIAASTGVIYGVITIAKYLAVQPGHAPSKADWEHLALPWSIPFYLYGAIFLEFLLRLGALCILYWLFDRVVLRRRFSNATFWTLNCIVALYEILPAWLGDVQKGEVLGVLSLPLQPLYLSNVFEGWLLRRFGWLSPIVFRVFFYLVWHILFGGLVKPQ